MPIILSALASAAGVIGMRLLGSLVAPKVLEWAMFSAADQLAKHTKTTFDDEGLAKVKEAYFGKQEDTEGPQG